MSSCRPLVRASASSSHDSISSPCWLCTERRHVTCSVFTSSWLSLLPSRAYHQYNRSNRIVSNHLLGLETGAPWDATALQTQMLYKQMSYSLSALLSQAHTTSTDHITTAPAQLAGQTRAKTKHVKEHWQELAHPSFPLQKKINKKRKKSEIRASPWWQSTPSCSEVSGPPRLARAARSAPLRSAPARASPCGAAGCSPPAGRTGLAWPSPKETHPLGTAFFRDCTLITSITEQKGDLNAIDYVSNSMCLSKAIN